jgi:hypothetical protein
MNVVSEGLSLQMVLLEGSGYRDDCGGVFYLMAIVAHTRQSVRVIGKRCRSRRGCDVVKWGISV